MRKMQKIQNADRGFFSTHKTKLMYFFWPLLLTLLIGLPLLFINSRIAFVRPANPEWHHISLLLKASYLFFFFITVVLLRTFYQNWKLGSLLHRRWLKYSGLYFGIIFNLFILLYPGHWSGDEFNILQSVKIFEPFSWQGYFTNIFFTYSLFTIPTGPAIVFFQISLIAIIIGYLLARIVELTNGNRKAFIFTLLVFVLPPVLINNLYPLRLTLYSYVSVLFLFELFRVHYKRYRVKRPALYLVCMAFLVMILAFWRSEGVLYLLFLPYLGYKLGILRAHKQPLVNTISVTASILIIALGFAITKETYNVKYEITVFANPMSQMLQEPLQGSETPQKLQVIDRVINVEMFRQHPSAVEIPAFWTPGGVREKTYAENLPEAKKAFIYIVIHNPDSFLEAKLRTFVATNGWTERQPQTEGLLAIDTQPMTPDRQTVDKFHNTNRFSGTISKPIKRSITRLLLFQQQGRMSWVGYPFWSVILPVITLFGIFIYRLFRRSYFLATLPGILLATGAIVFLTAPANYFMYYLPLYINAYFMLVVCFFAPHLTLQKSERSIK